MGYSDFTKPEWLDVIRYAKRDSKARARLVEAAQRYVIFVVRKIWFGPREHEEDVLQEANLGLLQAIDHYNPKKKVPFTAYARFWICAYVYNWEMKRPLVTVRLGHKLRFAFWRILRGEAGNFGCDEQVITALRAALAPPRFNGGTGSIGDHKKEAFDMAAPEVYADTALDLEGALAKLDPGVRQLVRDRLAGFSTREVARKHGRAVGWVVKHQQAAVECMQRALRTA